MGAGIRPAREDAGWVPSWATLEELSVALRSFPILTRQMEAGLSEAICMQCCGTTMQLGARGSPEPEKPRESPPRGRILVTATRCRKVGGDTKKHSRASLQVLRLQQPGLVGPEFRLTHRDRKDLILIQMRFPPLVLKGCASPWASGECVPLPASSSHCLSGWAASKRLADGQGASFVQGSQPSPLSEAGRTDNT